MKKPISIVNKDQAEQIVIPDHLSPHIYTFAYRYLQPNGWFNDYPCDEEGIAPWMTYPSVPFLKDVISKETKVFEYGSGFSTIFFNRIAGEVVCVEHDKEWADHARDHAPGAIVHHVEQNAPVHPEAQSIVDEFKRDFPQVRTDLYEHDFKHGLINDEFSGYASTIYNYPKGHFDVIVLDGMARLLTGVMACERIRDKGLIVLDNSDRWHYNFLQQYLVDNGFGRIDFWGPGYNNHSPWCTSIFARNLPFKNNRLGRPVTEGQITI